MLLIYTLSFSAWETLGDPIKKRSFDSVDPEFNDDIPPNNQHSKDNFFAVYGPVFERNARYDYYTGSFDNLIALWASKSVVQVAQPILKWLMVLCFNAMNNTFLYSISNQCLAALGNFVLILIAQINQDLMPVGNHSICLLKVFRLDCV